MKRKMLTVLVVVLLISVALCLSTAAFDANDYDYGGGGGGGFSYSSGDDFDGGGDLVSLLLAIVVVAIMCVYWAIKDKIEKHRNKKNPKTPTATKPPVVQHTNVVPANNGEGLSVPVPNRTVDIRDILRQSEPEFSEQAFLGNAAKLFADIRGAVCARNIDALRTVFTPEMFATLANSVSTLTERHAVEHCDNIAVTNAYLTSLVREGESEYLTVFIGAQYAHYLTDDNTGSIVEGDTGTVFSYRWLMTFSRSAGESAAECVHCGAPIAAGAERCEFCGCPVSVNSREWLVCKLDTVHDDTQDNGIK